MSTEKKRKTKKSPAKSKRLTQAELDETLREVDEEERELTQALLEMETAAVIADRGTKASVTTPVPFPKNMEAATTQAAINVLNTKFRADENTMEFGAMGVIPTPELKASSWKLDSQLNQAAERKFVNQLKTSTKEKAITFSIEKLNWFIDPVRKLIQILENERATAIVERSLADAKVVAARIEANLRIRRQNERENKSDVFGEPYEESESGFFTGAQG